MSCCLPPPEPEYCTTPDGCIGIVNRGNCVKVDGQTHTNYYDDADDDGYGAGSAHYRCTPLTGQVEQSGDCRPNDPNSHPGAVELCDGWDNSCNGVTDEGSPVHSSPCEGAPGCTATQTCIQQSGSGNGTPQTSCGTYSGTTQCPVPCAAVGHMTQCDPADGSAQTCDEACSPIQCDEDEDGVIDEALICEQCETL